MSIHAMAWVWRQRHLSSYQKFVLLALADNAGDTGLAWPSISTLSLKTGQDRRTVIRALDQLEIGGWIVDTGCRGGQTKSVKVYRLEWANERPTSQINGAENGTASDGSSDKDVTAKQSQICNEAVTSLQGSSDINAGSSDTFAKRTSLEPSFNHQSEPLRAREELATPKEIKLAIARISEAVFDATLPLHWSFQWEFWLDEAQPLKAIDLELIEWFYLRPLDHPIFKVTRKKQSIPALLQALKFEAQKIRAALKMIDSTGPLSRLQKIPVRDEPLPGAWAEALKKMFGPQAFVPALKKDLTPSVAKEVVEFLEQEKKNDAAAA